MARTRTQAQYDRAKLRRQERKHAHEMRFETMAHWKQCGWCGNRFNPPRPVSWLGVVICPLCADFPHVILHNMLDAKLVKLKKKSKLPHRRHRVAQKFVDPNRQWMKWVLCGYCSTYICVNNNPERKSSVQRWRGLVICTRCKRTVPRMLRQLVNLKYLKIKEPK